MVLLATQADFEMYSHIDVTAEPDASITARLESASAIIESYCNRGFGLETVTNEIHDGGVRTLFLRRPPVVSITSITENDVALVPDDYSFYPDGRLLRLTGLFPQYWYFAPQTVSVTYEGGYADIPADIRLVCVRIVERGFKAAAAYAAAPAASAAIKSISLAGSDSVTFADAVTSSVSAVAAPLTEEDRLLLDPYVLRTIQ